MNSSTTISPVPRSKSVFPNGQPNSDEGAGAGAGEKEPPGAYGPRIAHTALQSIGMCARNYGGPFTGPPEYAAAVSNLFTKATEQTIILGTEPKHVLSTSILCNSLLHDRRFKRVPMSEAAPGDILIESAGHQADGYAGIVVDHGRIVSNSNQGVQNNSSLVEIQRSQPATVIFRYIGVQGHCAYPLANAGYNPNEPRVPAGQSGGGQWTGTGAGTARRESRYNAAKPAPAPTPSAQQRRVDPHVKVAQDLSAPDDNEENKPKTIGQAAKETAQAFLSALASGLRSFLFPSEPDRETSKPRTILQLAKEIDDAADDIDMTKPKGLGSAMAAGAIIAAAEALSEGGGASAPKPAPSGLDAISDAKARVQASSDTYGNLDAQNMGSRGGAGPVNKGKEGVGQSEAEAIAAGEKVKGKEVTFELPSGKRTRSDLLTENEEGLKAREAKKGPTAKLSAAQIEMQQTSGKGGTVIPRGANAQAAGLKPGEPIKIPQHKVDHY